MNDNDVKRLFDAALDAEEASLVKAHEALTKAQIDFDVASRKYAALRDLFTEKFNQPAYTPESLAFAARRNEARGRYRFILLGAAEAITMALQEAKGPLSLGALYTALESGGWALESGGPSLRSINAALMKTAGIVKTDDDKYSLKSSGLDQEKSKRREFRTA